MANAGTFVGIFRSPRKFNADSAARGARSAAALILLVVIWELCCLYLKVPAYILPAPTAIIADLVQQIPDLVSHTIVTFQEALGGFLIAIVLGIPLAMMISFSALARDVIYPSLIVSQMVPKVVLAPLFIIWFGIGLAPKFMMVFLLCFFPIVLSSITGFRSIESEMIELARSTGASAWRQFRLIRFPYALPSIFIGVKIAATNAMIGAIVAEYVSSDRGLGYLLLVLSGNMQTTRVFAVIFLLSVTGVLIYWMAVIAEKLLIPWHSSQRSDGSR